MELTALARAKGPFYLITEDEAVSHWMPDPGRGYTNTYLSPETHDIVGMSVGTQRMEVGESLGLHHHPRGAEILHVYRGEGTAVIDGKPCVLKPGSLVYLGRNISHNITNVGNEPMEWVFVYLPGGLEHVLNAVGAPRVPGEPRPEKVDWNVNVLGSLAQYISAGGHPGDAIDPEMAKKVAELAKEHGSPPA